MKNKKENKKNMLLHYRPVEKKAKEPIKLFNCHECGFHEKVISKMWIDGYEDECIVQFKSIHPNFFRVDFIFGESFKMDGKVIEELSCGICGFPGQMLPVADEVLEMFGFSRKRVKVKSKAKVLK